MYKNKKKFFLYIFILNNKLISLEQSNATINALDKKQRNFDKEIATWKQRVEEIQSELDASQRESRNYQTEVYKLRTSYEESIEQLEIVKRENKNLSGELKLDKSITCVNNYLY